MALSEPEIEQLRGLLSKLEPGFLPTLIFYEFARVGVMSIVEIVPLRRTAQGEIQVLFTRREANDPFWPNLLHTPGTVVRATDKEGDDFAEPLTRILTQELPNVQTNNPVFVQNKLHRGNRGMELAHVYYAEVLGDSPVGEFHDIEQLPADVVDTQLPFIRECVRVFKERAAA